MRGFFEEGHWLPRRRGAEFLKQCGLPGNSALACGGKNPASIPSTVPNGQEAAKLTTEKLTAP